MCRNGGFVVAHHITQNRFSVSSKHGKFPAAGQLRIGELQRKIRQHHATETWIVHSDDKTALLQVPIVDQVLAGLHNAAWDSCALQFIPDRECVFILGPITNERIKRLTIL